MLPEGAELVLPAHVPERDLDISELQGLNVEADGGDGGDELALLELAEQGGLACPVQAQDHHSHLNLDSCNMKR